MCAPEAPPAVRSLGVRTVPRAVSFVRRPDLREPLLAVSAGPPSCPVTLARGSLPWVPVLGRQMWTQRSCGFCKDVEMHLAPSSSSVGATHGGSSVRVRNAFREGPKGPPKGAQGSSGVPEGRSERFCPRPRVRAVGRSISHAEGRVAKAPNRRRALAFPVAGTREARWEQPGVTSACVVPARSRAHSHTTRGRTRTHTPSHTPPPSRLGADADGPARWWRREPSHRSRYLHLGCVLLCSGGSIGYCVRRTGLCQLSPQRGSHPCLSLSPVLTDARGRLGTASFSGVGGVVGRGGLRPSQGAPECLLGAADLPGELAPGRGHGGSASCCQDSGFPPGEKAGLSSSSPASVEVRGPSSALTSGAPPGP